MKAKFATALAVLVMAVCALCVIAPVGDVSAEDTECTVTYYIADGNTVDVKVTFNETTTSYTVATPATGLTIAEGYEVLWYKDAEFTTAVSTLAVGDFTEKAITLYGKVVKTTVTVTFEYGDKTASFTLDYGSAVTAPADIAVEGKIFKAWYDKSDETKTAVTEIPVATKAVTYVAEYVDDITLRFVVDGELQDTLLSVMEVPEIPAKSGYTAQGWVIDGAEEVTVYATAEEIYAAVFGGTETVILTAYYVEDAEPVTPVEPETPTESDKDNSGIYAILAVLAVVVIVGAAVFVWTLKKDKNN